MTVLLSSFTAPNVDATVTLNSMIGLYGTQGIEIDIPVFVQSQLQGTFKLPSNNVQIYGAGGKLTVLQTSYVAGSNYAVFNTWGKSGFIMEGLEVDGGRSTASVGGAIGNQILYIASGSNNTTVVGNNFHDLPNVASGESFAIMSAGGSVGLWAERNTISGIAGSAFNVCGVNGIILQNIINACDWNSISVFGGIQSILSQNICTNAGKRNINIENLASLTSVVGNICTNAVQSNIGTFTAVSGLLISDNVLSNANSGGFKLGEIDFSQGPLGKGVVVGGNSYTPRQGGWKISMDKGSQSSVIISDPQISSTDLLLR